MGDSQDSVECGFIQHVGEGGWADVGQERYGVSLQGLAPFVLPECEALAAQQRWQDG